MQLDLHDQNLRFEPVPLAFENGKKQNVFAHKNNKTLRETVAHKRYQKFSDAVALAYPDALDEPLGQFLLHLKQSGDLFYKKFLNKNGDLAYSTFKLANSKDYDKKGVYAFTVDSTLRYIGRCKDAMKKRIDNGYGKIHPKNCFLDGQSTNCHLNALITETRGTIALWLHPLSDDKEIERIELDLISHHQPSWNVQGL